MKKFLSVALICALIAISFSGCGQQQSDNSNTETQSVGNFEPEATAISSQSNQGNDDSLAALMDLNTAAPATQEAVNTDPIATDAPVIDEPAAVDTPVETAADATVEATTELAADTTLETTAEPVAAQPFATPTPQPNTAITNYSEISGTGLGFKFSYPTGWNNIPGRSTVCYVQPLENGTEYPARVAVTMKTLAHKCNEEKAQTELAEYIKLLMSQYDEKTFEVDKELDTETRFMGNKALSTSYLAYDGNQEIQGYVILTWFEKYVFCYHFLSAYEDYAAFDTAMRHMRDSVQPVQSDFETEDD